MTLKRLGQHPLASIPGLQNIKKLSSFILEFASNLFGEHTSGERSKAYVDKICAWRWQRNQEVSLLYEDKTCQCLNLKEASKIISVIAQGGGTYPP